MNLSLVCVTQAKSYALSFLRELAALSLRLNAEFVVGLHECETPPVSALFVPVHGEFMEQMLDPVFAATSGRYILRLDDDERCSPAMIEWLVEEWYLEHECWGFPRVHLWPDTHSSIASIFPDSQFRLAVREKSSRAAVLHVGPPWPQHIARVLIEHHNFLVKTKEERRAIGANYARIQGRAYDGMAYPEDAHESLRLWPYPGPWPPKELWWKPNDKLVG